MAERRYPIVLVCNETPSYIPGLPTADQPKQREFEKIVHNETEYNSFIEQHKNGTGASSTFHDLSERKPTWKELKGNIFKRVYYWLPKWAIAGIASLITFVGSHLKDIWEFIKALIHH